MLRPQLGEEHDVANGCLIGKQHHQAIDADAFSGRGRHPIFERAQKIFVDEMGFFVTRGALRGLRFKSLALVERIVQLGEGVRDLPPGDVQLEAIGQRGVGILSTGQRRNLYGIVGNEGRLLQIGLDRLFEDLVENYMERALGAEISDRVPGGRQRSGLHHWSFNTTRIRACSLPEWPDGTTTVSKAAQD